MLYFILGVIVGLLVNPFRKEVVEKVTEIKKEGLSPHVSFIEPKEDITKINSLKDYLHD